MKTLALVDAKSVLKLKETGFPFARESVISEETATRETGKKILDRCGRQGKDEYLVPPLEPVPMQVLDTALTPPSPPPHPERPQFVWRALRIYFVFTTKVTGNYPVRVHRSHRYHHC